MAVLARVKKLRVVFGRAVLGQGVDAPRRVVALLALQPLRLSLSHVAT